MSLEPKRAPFYKKTRCELPPERIGILLVHGVGEQRNFEHLESEAREILRAIRQEVDEDGKCARVTLQVLTTQNGVYLGERENWKAEGTAPVIIDVNYADDDKGEGEDAGASAGVGEDEGEDADSSAGAGEDKGQENRDQSFEFREVWWADLDEPSTFMNAIRFWFWGLSLWARPMFVKPPKPDTKGGKRGSMLPGYAEHMIPPGKDDADTKRPSCRPPRTTLATRIHLFLTATIFTLILATLMPISWLLKKLGIPSIRPADILVRYLADVKLYQQAKRGDLWPLVDMGRPPRVMIRRRTIRAITDIALADYDRWYILAHSLGTVVACNALMETAHSIPNYLSKEQWEKVLKNAGRSGKALGGVQRPDIDEMDNHTEDMMPCRPVWLEDNHVMYRDRLFAKFRGILTYGSPLDKFAALFPATVPLNKNAAVYAKDTQWINVLDMTDPVAGKLDYFDTPKDANKASSALDGVITIKPVNYAYSAHWALLYSHICYLKFKEGRTDRLVNVVTRWLLNAEPFTPPARGSPGWPGPTLAFVRKVWRYLQDVIVVVLATLSLVWLLKPLLAEATGLLERFDNKVISGIGTFLQNTFDNIAASAQGGVNNITGYLPFSTASVPEYVAKALLYFVIGVLIALAAGALFQAWYRFGKFLEWLKKKFA